MNDEQRYRVVVAKNALELGRIVSELMATTNWQPLGGATVSDRPTHTRQERANRIRIHGDSLWAQAMVREEAE